MTKKRIVDVSELDMLVGTEKIPTGGRGVKTTNPRQIGDYIQKYLEIVTDDQLASAIRAHTQLTNNPHLVTKEQVGLGDVDNTNDMDKPVSTAVQIELDKKLEADGNVFSATRLQNSVMINKTMFNGTQHITTDEWGKTRNISLTGDATATISTNGGSDVSTPITLSNTGVVSGSYGAVRSIPVINVDTKGRVTSAQAVNIPDATTAQTGLVQLNNTLTSTSTTQALTANAGKVLNDKMFGVDQSPVDVTGSRIVGTTYTNTTGRTIFVSVYTQLTGNRILLTGVVNGTAFTKNGGDFESDAGVAGVCFPVTTGATYRVDLLGDAGVDKWWELR